MPLGESAPDRKHVLPGASRATVALVLAVSFAAVGAAAAPAGHAMTFALTTDRIADTAGSQHVVHEIRATGSFERGDTDRLADLLGTVGSGAGGSPDRPTLTVSFDSKGGVLEEGIRMGRLLRQKGIATRVHAGKRCLSACALAFLGGARLGPEGTEPDRRLEIGSQLGFHAFYAPRDVDARDAATSRARGVTEGRAMSAVIISYVIEVEADPAIMLRTLVRPPDELTYVETAGEFASLGICPVGLPVPRAALVERTAHICNNATQGKIPAWPDLVNEYTPMEARRLLIGRIAHGAAQANVRAGVAARLQQVLRGGRGTEAIYDELAAAGLPLPVMRARAFHLELPRSDQARTSCLVTMSPTDQADYGVVLIGPAGLLPPRLSAPAGCPELFLRGHDEVINLRVLALADGG